MTPQVRLEVTEQAARWLMELQTEGPVHYPRFAQWLRRSPEHVEEFLAITSISRQLDGFDRERRIDIASLLADDGAEIIHLTQRVQPSPPVRSGWVFGLAAACVLLGALLLMIWIPAKSETYSTRVGEQRSVKLMDGSLIQLNTRSEVSVRFSEQARTVRLLEGEALFTVEPDGKRPFVVITETATVRVLGTQFNVYRSSAGTTTVSVLEGKVSVTPVASGMEESRQLAVGEQAQVEYGRLEARRSNVTETVAWRERRLVFHDKPLKEVAAEFNRYNTLQIRIEGDIAHEPFSGVFAADRPESLVSFLEKDPALVIERRGAGVVVRSHRP
jgi:transmembrane sensor